MSLPKIGQLRVEAAELFEHRAPHQHPGGVHRERGADVVVLSLVELAAFEAGLAATGAADGDAELQKPPQRGPLAQLGSQDVGVRVRLGRRQQRLERPRVRPGVVVEQPHPLAVADVLEPERHRVREGGGAVCLDDAAERLSEQLRALVSAGRVDRHHGIHGCPLLTQPFDDGRKPAGTVMADDDGGDRGIHGRRH